MSYAQHPHFATAPHAQHQHHSYQQQHPHSAGPGLRDDLDDSHHAFMPPSLDPDEAARQRFLELTSTPSKWGDSQRFSPNLTWD
jgi:hypothetical protein